MQLKISLIFAAVMLLSQPAMAAQEKAYKGTWRFGSEEETFSPCGTHGKEWWVITSEDNWNALRDASGRLNATLEDGIFLEVRGFYDGPATEEKSGAFSTQYEGVFRITKIVSARKRANQDCR